jgi:predicted nucleic-acid-binding protein
MLIDANVILRFLIGDNPEMMITARQVIESGEAYTLPSVLAEVIYVLNGHYEVERTVIRDTLKHLLDRVGIEYPDVVKSALDYYADRNVDFVDALLISRAKLLGEEVLSFDKRLNRLMSE